MLTEAEPMAIPAGVRTVNMGDYDVAGPQDGRPILLVHGSTVTRKSWLMQVDALRSSYRMIIPDLPGHGALSGKPFEFETAVSCLYDIVQKEARGPVLIAGISLGGYVAMMFAERYPELVDGLVISGASSNIHGAIGLWMRLVGKIMLRFFREEQLRVNLEKSLWAKWPAPVVQAQVSDGLFPLGAAQSFLQIPRYDYRRIISRICAPVLILNGERDRPNRKGETAFAAAAQNCRVEAVPNAGHACNVENADDYNRRLLQFANEVALGMGR